MADISANKRIWGWWWFDWASQPYHTLLVTFVFGPFFAAVAVFLYGRFDHSVLTLLWAGEAFAVFLLAAILRENHFRYLALAALAAFVVRLVAYDLAQSGTLARGLVFLGVGVLMLSMNTIYARFKPRFE